MAGPTEDVPGVREYFHFIKEAVSSDWKDLAFQLGFTRADNNNIASRNRDDKSRCMDLLEEWLKRDGDRATLEVLVEALSKAGLQSTVDGLNRRYAPKKEGYRMSSHNELNTEQETQKQGDFQQGFAEMGSKADVDIFMSSVYWHFQEWCKKANETLDALKQKVSVEDPYAQVNYRATGDDQQTNEQAKQEETEVYKERIEKAVEILLGRSVNIQGSPEQDIHKDSGASGALESSVAATTKDAIPGSYEGSPEEGMLTFHPKVHGTHIYLEGNGTIARSRDSFNNGICFSRMPITSIVGEKISLRVVDSRIFDESMRFGFTSRDPNSMAVEELPAQSYPTLAQQPGFWLKPFPGSLARQGCVVTFSVKESGDVNFAVDGESKGLFFSGVDVSKPLWAVVDVHGSAVALQFVDEQAVCDAKDQFIHKWDQVQLWVEHKETFRDMQTSHGGFDSDMEKAMGEVGIVFGIDDDGDMHVFFPSVNQRWCINPAALQKVNRPDVRSKAILEGDLVKITTNLDMLKQVQKEQGIWMDEMEKTLGKIGRVKGVLRDGDIGVRVEGEDSDWIYNPRVVDKIENESLDPNMCNQGLHHNESGFSRVCVKCGECTSARTRCSMTGKPLRPPGSCCGCAKKDAGCAYCGQCKSCTGEGSDEEMFGKVLDHLKHAFLRPLEHLSEGLGDDEPNEHGLKRGDQVQVNVDQDTFKKLQRENGIPWKEDMSKVIGVPGIITTKLLANDVFVHFENGERAIVFSGCLTKMSSGTEDIPELFEEGDLVSLIKDPKKLEKLQKGHGGYVEGMQDCLGKTGCVKKVHKRRAQVDFLHISVCWWFNSAALTKVSTVEKQETVHRLTKGDCVKVAVDVETFKANQVGHGGCVDPLTRMTETAGVVKYTDLEGDAFICFLNGLRHLVNPASLEKVNPEDFMQADDTSELRENIWVKVDSDKVRIKQVQKATETIKWDDGYFTVAGKIGVVEKFDPASEIAHVSIFNAVFPLNSALVKRASLNDMQEEFSRVRASCFARGDLVSIGVGLEDLKSLQKGHGGYKADMEKLLQYKETGSVCFFDYEGDVYVRFNIGRLCFNPAVLSKATITEDKVYVGDLVQIESDLERFKTLQTPTAHGGYNNKMDKLCGSVGRVLSVIDDKKIQVKVQGVEPMLNPDVLRRMGNPRDATAEWRSATICAPGKHNWSMGWPLVCVVCGECIQHGKLCYAPGGPDKPLGSVTGCSGGKAGCDDCGCCLKCAGEGMAEKKAAVHDSKTIVEKHRLSEFSGELEAQTKRLLPVFENLSQCIELIGKSKDLDSIQEVSYALCQQIEIPMGKSSGPDRKQIADYLANIGAAQAFMDYWVFLSTQACGNEDLDKEQSDCLRMLFGIVNNCAHESTEFSRAVGRSGLLQVTAQELARQKDKVESKVNEGSKQMLSILGNCARCPENLDYFRDMGAEALLKKHVKDECMPFRVMTLSCLAHFVDVRGQDHIQMQTEDIDFFVSRMNTAVAGIQHECQAFESTSWTASGLVRDLVSLVRHDGNKHEFVKKGVMEPLIQLIESGDNTEKEYAMLCVQRFAMVDSIRDTILSESRVEEVLRALLREKDRIYAVQAVARKTLKCLGKEHTSA